MTAAHYRQRPAHFSVGLSQENSLLRERLKALVRAYDQLADDLERLSHSGTKHSHYRG